LIINSDKDQLDQNVAISWIVL